MAITETFSDKVQTPKKKAQDILYDSIHTFVTFWEENRDLTGDMTDRERQQVTDQLGKIARRLYKHL